MAAGSSGKSNHESPKRDGVGFVLTRHWLLPSSVPLALVLSVSASGAVRSLFGLSGISGFRDSFFPALALNPSEAW